MEKRLKDAGYVKRDDYYDEECCHCAYKKRIDDSTLYCTKLNIYVGEEDVCNYFYDFLKTEKGDKLRSQIKELARLYSRNN